MKGEKEEMKDGQGGEKKGEEGGEEGEGWEKEQRVGRGR